MKAVKYGAIALGGLIVLVLLLAGALLLFFDPNSYKGDLQAQVKKHTGRDLALPGALKLSLFPSIALEFGPASLGNAAGFGNQPMVSVERVKLGVRLSPLLHKRVEVASVEVTRPVVALAVDTQGRDNWTDLTKTAESSADEPSSGSSPVAISIHRLRIAAASVSYRDAQKASQMTLSDFNLEAGALGSGTPEPLQTSFVLSTGPDLTVGVKLKSKLSVDLENERYVFAAPRFDLQLSGTSFPKSGVAVALQAASLGLDLKAQTLDLPQMQADALGARLTASLKGASIVDAPTFAGPIEVADVSLRELLPKLGVAVPNTKDPAVLERLHVAGTLAATSKSLAIDKLQMQLDDSTATGSAAITDLDSMAMRFDLALDRINADRYLEPAPAGTATAAAKRESPPVQIPAEMLRSLKLRGALKVAEAVFAGVKFTAMQVGVDAAGGKVHVSPLQAQMYGGQYRGDINLDATGVPRVSFNDQVSGVNFASLGRDWLETSKISGRGNLQVKATAVGKDSAAMIRTLNGSLGLKVDDGAYEGIDLLYEIQRASALLKKQAPVARPAGPPRTAFSALSATGAIVNGVVTSNDITAATRLLKVTGKGSTDLPAGTLDYRLDAAVNRVPEASASAETADVVGFTIPVRITGSLSDPTVRPDLEALAKDVVKQKLDDKKKEVEQQLRDKLGDKLKGLFGQ